MMLSAPFLAEPPPLRADFTQAGWRKTATHTIDRLWSGTRAPASLATSALVAWTRDHLWIGFECAFQELDADSGSIDTSAKRVALWERDVCEAFVWNPREPHQASYKEFEVAPTGQWCDLAIHQPRVDVDVQWTSGMETAAAIDHAAGIWRAVMRVPFTAFGGRPVVGEVWRANLFRISRSAGERQYLTLEPTGTATPDFHVPTCFVPLRFLESKLGSAHGML